MEMLKDKVALITGAARGIGKAIALKYASEGANIAFTDLVINEAAEETVKELEAFGVKVKAYASNAAEFEATQAVVDQVVADFGRIDILVNNAGFGISGAVEDTALDSAKKQLDVNFFGCFLCCKAAVPYLRQSGGGRIINISSMAAVLSIPFQSFYSASKSAINALTLALANEVRPFNITVCALMPGDVKTGFTAAREKSESSGAYEAVVQKSVATMEHDEQNGMTPRQLAEAVFHLATKKHPKPLSTCGTQYKVFAVLQKALPQRLVNAIVGKIYT